MSNLEIINAGGKGYTTEIIRPFSPSECDRNGSMSFKVKANGHFKKKVEIGMSASSSGGSYTVRINGGTMNGKTEFTKNYPFKSFTTEQSILDFTLIEKEEVEVEFTNEAIITLEQELPHQIPAKEKGSGWTWLLVTCEKCNPYEEGKSTVYAHSTIGMFDESFRIEGFTCSNSSGGL